jgi:hypothetical protein
MSDERNDRIRPSAAGKLLDAETWEALKAMGVSEQELLEAQPFGPMIASYTRRQAIDDGVLVDLMQGQTAELVRQAGFRLPIAMTATAYGEAVSHVGGDVAAALPAGQSIAGRMWDLLMVLHAAIRKARPGVDRVHFRLLVDDGGGHRRTVRLWCQVGPGDDAEPVMTVMLEGED